MNNIIYSKIYSKNIIFLKDSYISDFLKIKFPGIDITKSIPKVKKDLEDLVLNKNYVIYIAKQNTNAIGFIIGKVSSNKFFKKEVVISSYYKQKGLYSLLFKKISNDYNIFKDFSYKKPFKKEFSK
ncbi:MAG: hypothetical protein PHR26_01730 [Candidatus ainarchaeum sp.]|nr:hypothetical protein [Candidatus ainarchaeum sp.]MDD3975699.1 hypothetical protein [Candidatus ainarchaeum sp.]